MKVAVIDYGMGNVFNVERALQAIGCYVTITNDPLDIEAADAILLPGVGAFLASHSRAKPLLVGADGVSVEEFLLTPVEAGFG